MIRVPFLLVALATAVAAVPAAAVTNFTTNFDSVTIGAPGYATLSSIEGWTAGPLGVEVQANGIGGAPKSGANLIELDTSANSFISRTIDAGIYTLKFYYSPRPGFDDTTNGVGVSVNGVQLFAAEGDGSDETATTWIKLTTHFTATAASTLTFSALGTSDGAGGYLDNIQLAGTALPVPEPGEWAMIAAGLGVIGVAANRRRRTV